MIQRIQTLFLLVAVVLISLIFFEKIASFISQTGEIYYLYLGGLKTSPDGNIIYNTLPLLVLNIIMLALIFFSIFLYKRRILQMRLVVYTMLLILGFIGVAIYYVLHLKNQLLIESITFSYTAIFPIIAFILLYLAFRGIRRDEILIRSIDRIR
ncbi:MAG: DUF4293 domain-containing protein [bacterium]